MGIQERMNHRIPGLSWDCYEMGKKWRGRDLTFNTMSMVRSIAFAHCANQQLTFCSRTILQITRKHIEQGSCTGENG